MNQDDAPNKTQIKSFRDLKVWQQATDLVVASYELSKRLPPSEIYGLSSQIQRAAVSIPANIAEGHGRDHLGDYLHHLSMANGSLHELETHLLLTCRLSYLKIEEVEPALKMASEIGRMLSGLSQKLRNRQSRATVPPHP
jgi:four helix bundle protein